MSSVYQRQELLDLLYDVLKQPDYYGDKFFTEIVKRSPDGMVIISSIHDMVLACKDYPTAYISHCIPLDLQKRFRISSDHTKVGLRSHPSNTETDQFGNDLNQEATIDTNSVRPVLYQDGQFYVDDEPYKTSLAQKDKDVLDYKYDLLDIHPMGLKGEIVEDEWNHCYNCGGDHKLKDCTLMLNKLKVAKARLLLNNYRAQRRLHLQMELECQTMHLAPGILSSELRRALGIEENEDPPYYRSMRAIGYPPGYMGKDGDQIPHGSKLIPHCVEPPLLKIYQNDEDQEERVVNEEHPSNTKMNYSKVQIVYYPNLNIENAVPAIPQTLNYEQYQPIYPTPVNSTYDQRTLSYQISTNHYQENSLPRVISDEERSQDMDISDEDGL